eukprot:s874_g6.t1
MTWRLSTANPTGLTGKAKNFEALAPGIVAVSESHLTPQGIVKFGKELHGTKSPFALMHGNAAPYRANAVKSYGGRQTGVAFLHSFPGRPVQAGWDMEQYQSSRLASAHFWLDTTWIQGGVAYGFAHQSTSSSTKELTNDLLCQLTQQVVANQHGLAFVAGDWNQHFEDLREPRRWEAWGWKDVQQLAFERWNITPTNTCKQTSRKDFLYLSPQLQKLVVSVTNTWDQFSDHSILSAVMQYPANPPRVAIWAKPRPIKYQDKQEIQAIRESDDFKLPQETDASDQYAAIFASFENLVTQVKKARGQQGLLPSQKGRGATRERHFQTKKVSPLKASRHGEETPGYAGINLRYKRWFTQYRRLVSYVNHVRHDRVESSAYEHKLKLWRAILHAPGFPPKFASWWPHRVTAQAQGLWFVPLNPPNFAVAAQLLQQFHTELKHCESELNQQRIQYHKTRYEQDANHIFRDVRRPGAQPVQVLIAKEQATVQAVPSPVEIVTAEPLPAVSHAWQSTQGQHVVKQASDHVTEFQQPHGLVPGDVICSHEMLGATEEIHAAFAKEWTQRWDKHLHLPANHWEEINKYIDMALPTMPMQYNPITLDSWKQVVRSKKSRSAIGMDGVSKQDLEAMPDSFHSEIIKLLMQAESSGIWPQQALHGAIHSLAKRENAETTGDYRPITILPIIYRCWSSLRAAEVLRHVEKLAPPTMLGNLPGRSSPAVWYHLQSLIERCLYDGDSCHGVVTDLIKAFNGIPREPTFHAAIHVGICAPIIRAWMGAVTGVTRHFFIRGEPGPGLRSSSGFPEGCPLSVAAMCLCNLVVHSFMSHRCPRTMMISYVDNLELLDSVPDGAIDAIDTLSSFTGFLGVPTDPKKTYSWSLDAQGRKALRAANHEVKRNQPDLGAHLQYSAQQTNGSVKQKCADLQSLWAKLAQSQAPMTHKWKILTTVAWPRAFHSASTVHLTDTLIQELRAGAMKGLRLDKAGANAVLQFSLNPNTMLDPGYFLLWDSLVQFRRFADLETAHVTMALAFWQPDRLKKPGPVGVLAARLSQIGWTYTQGFLFLDQEQQPIDIVKVPIHELKARAKRAWQHKAGCDWAFRKGFAGLEFVDVVQSKQIVPDFSQEEAGLLRALHNGTFMTQDQFQDAKQVDHDRCKFCQQPDSLEHRHWQCPATAHLRQALSEECKARADASPACTRQRGWLVECPELPVFKQMLADVPEHLQIPSMHSQPSEKCLDLFTDGSCLSPQVPAARLAAWAVTQAVGPLADQQFLRVASGGLPGQWQTVVRAELMAVITAVCIAKAHTGHTRLWCDNALVVRRFRLLQQGRFVPKLTKPDHDLWMRLADVVHNHPFPLSIYKVASHQQEETEDEFLSWVFAGNTSADHAASFAMACLPGQLLAQQNALHHALVGQKRFQRELHTYFAKVGMMSVLWQEPDDATQQEANERKGREPILPEQEVSLAYVSAQAIHAPVAMQFDGFHKLREWLLHVQAPAETAPTWVTWYELFWSFQMNTGIRSLQKVNAHSKWKQQDPKLEYDTVKECKNFMFYLTHLIRVAYPEFSSKGTDHSELLQHARERLIRGMNSTTSGIYQAFAWQARRKQCKAADMNFLMRRSLLMKNSEDFAMGICVGGAFMEANELARRIAPELYDDCSPLWALPIGRMDFLFALQSQWPTFLQLQLLSERISREYRYYGKLCDLENAELPFAAEFFVMLRPDELEEKVRMCGGLRLVLRYLDRAAKATWLSADWSGDIATAERLLKMLAHGSSLADLMSAIGQLPEERSPWVLLSRMQKRWW